MLVADLDVCTFAGISCPSSDDPNAVGSESLKGSAQSVRIPSLALRYQSVYAFELFEYANFTLKCYGGTSMTRDIEENDLWDNVPSVGAMIEMIEMCDDMFPIMPGTRGTVIWRKVYKGSEKSALLGVDWGGWQETVVVIPQDEIIVLD